MAPDGNAVFVFASDKTTRYNINYTEGFILEPRVKSRAKANETIISMGGPPILIICLLALALDFTLVSMIYPLKVQSLFTAASTATTKIKEIGFIPQNHTPMQRGLNRQ